MTLKTLENLILDSDNEMVWELFHENSKLSFTDPHPVYRLWPSEESIAAGMAMLRRVKRYDDYPKIALRQKWPAARVSLDDVLSRRQTARAFGPDAIELHQLAKVLWMSYGVNRDNKGTVFPRPLRTVPSGGALYPLELYIYALRVKHLKTGLYHYDPEGHSLDVLRQRDESRQVARCMVQQDLVESAAAVIFITAIFARSTFKYGDRGYRFILLEAGHLAQNANLAAQGMGLATTNIGGYADRLVDRYLDLDGLNESTVYVLLIGEAVSGEAR